jgi:large subunit ribosomal protein L6
MSRVARNPIKIPKGIEVNLQGRMLTITGTKGSLKHHLPERLDVKLANGVLFFSIEDGSNVSSAMAGTTRAIVNNLVLGVLQGFERKLTLVGVGYRAQVQGKVLNLAIGYSHSVDFNIPEGISIETPNQTDILVKGIDKQKVGQVAAKIRGFRSPEPYQGKGIRYAEEVLILKETKKK